MVIADTALAEREGMGRPIRVALVGAGVTGRMIALQLCTPVPGIRRDDGVGDPVGNVLNHNLIRALLKNTTLMPTDLELLRTDSPE